MRQARATKGGSDVVAIQGLIERLQRDYAARRPRSRALYSRALERLPGGNSRTQLYFYPFPFYASNASGAQLTDVDGLTYLDFVNNYTSLVHGHRGHDLADMLAPHVSRGTAFGAPTELELDLADEICSRVTSVEQIRFANSGTEATLYALQTARAFTGRDIIVKVEGGYHGGHDSVQVSVRRWSNDGLGIPEVGVSSAMRRQTHVIPFNDVDAASRKLRSLGNEVAAVIVEPVMGAAGAIPATQAFLTELRLLTEEVGALLIFDEVLTLRLAYGGAQELYNVQPDLTAMGKIIGGGFPIGAFGGRAEIMEVSDPRRAGMLSHSGTFNGNPIAMAAGLFALHELTRDRIVDINARGERMRRHVSKAAAEANVAITASGLGSLLQLHGGTEPPHDFRDALSRPRELVQAAFWILLAEGVFTTPGRTSLNVSTAVGDVDQARVHAALERVMEELGSAVG